MTGIAFPLGAMKTIAQIGAATVSCVASFSTKVMLVEHLTAGRIDRHAIEGFAPKTRRPTFSINAKRVVVTPIQGSDVAPTSPRVAFVTASR